MPLDEVDAAFLEPDGGHDRRVDAGCFFVDNITLAVKGHKHCWATGAVHILRTLV